MDKNIINEELEKFKLLSSYSTKNTLSENIEQILEQFKSPEEEIFYNLVQATTGTFGTNENKLKAAFGKIKNPKQYKEVEKIMSQRPIMGKHKTITTLLNDVLESDDAPTFLEIQKILEPKGINFTAAVGKSGKQMNPSTIKISFGKPAGEEIVTASGKESDEPTGDMAKIKDLEPVVVKAKKDETTKFRPNDTFPLKMGDSGPKIKKLQFCLGLPEKYQTGNFGEITMKAIADDITSSVNKNQPPHGAHIVFINRIRREGIDKNTYDSFIKRCKGVLQKKTTRVEPEIIKPGTTQLVEPVKLDRERPDLSTGLPDNLPTVSPTLQAPNTELGLEQQFKLAKMKLDAAKQELDAAQATRDRAKIGAARGKQQAARKEVQRLRNELYPPEQ